MKVVILAGGLGTRLSEETIVRPKPMVEIGGKPILWHIMHIYAHHGFTEFVIALGYKGEMIKDYFLNFYAQNSDVSVDLATGGVTVHDGARLPWKVHLIDTGLSTQTGGRLGRLKPWVSDGTFMMTYGDGLCDVNVRELLAHHREHRKLATVTAVRPAARFGGLGLAGDTVVTFKEKPQSGEGWVNGGYFVLEPGVLDFIDGDGAIWEREPMERLAGEGQLKAFPHEGFWQPMDTLREKLALEAAWQSGQAPWKVWGV